MPASGKKRVVVAGATGTIGKALSKCLIESGYELVVISRNPDSAREIVPGAIEYVAWKPEEQDPWANAIEEHMELSISRGHHSLHVGRTWSTNVRLTRAVSRLLAG